MSFFGSLVGTVAKVATTAFTIIKTALPILKALRPAVDEIDKAFGFIEEKILEGGVAADDFLDRNLPAVIALERVSLKGVEVFTQFNELAVKLRVYSQEETPDTITDEEAIQLGLDLYNLRSLLNGWGPELDKAIEKMADME
jgi:hypothetical protein